MILIYFLYQNASTSLILEPIPEGLISSGIENKFQWTPWYLLGLVCKLISNIMWVLFNQGQKGQNVLHMHMNNKKERASWPPSYAEKLDMIATAD